MSEHVMISSPRKGGGVDDDLMKNYYLLSFAAWKKSDVMKGAANKRSVEGEKKN